MYTVYGRATSSNVQALLWGMEELGLTYDRLHYGEVFGGLETPVFRTMNPHGKIPVLKVGETALFETAAILRFLAAEHGSDAFWPVDHLRRAEVDIWAEWAKYEVAGRFTGPVFWRSARTRPENRDLGLIRTNVERLEAELALVEPRLAAVEFICGSALTLADIQLGHVLYRYFDIEIERAPLPALAAYYARLTGRPAFQKAVMISYDQLSNAF